MTPTEYLAKLQSEARDEFHYKLKAWVHNKSEVARVLRAMEKL